MKIIIPMAGMGTRMRPQTLTTPKPLLPISGKSIVQRLIEELAKSVNEKVDEIAYIIGDFGKEVENTLLEIANNLEIKAKIYYQLDPLGTGHAIYCAKESLEGNVIVAFADTLFKTDFKLDKNQDGIIWVKKVDKPEAFGVVKVNNEGNISDFVEKPKDFVSDLAIIGIYYFKDGENLRKEIEYIIDNNIRVGKEYQLTTVLENMKNDNKIFKPGEVKLWMDCGNKLATIDTNSQILKFLGDWERKEKGVIIKNSKVIDPCYLGENVIINNCVIGPNASIEANSKITNCIIKDSIIQTNCIIENQVISHSMFGNFVTAKERINEFNLGDYTKIEND